MNNGMSSHAIRGLDDLASSRFINWVIRGGIHDPAMGGTEQHPNWRIFGSMEWYLTGRQVAHAGDTLNTYCQLILAEVLESETSAWELIRRRLSRKNESREDVVIRLKDCGYSDGVVRNTVCKDLKVYWSPESDLIIKLRNKIVHQSGVDTTGEVRRELAKLKASGGTVIKPTDLPRDVIPLAFESDNRLIIDAATGFWATRHIENHIHLMDQNLSARYRLPTQRWRPRNDHYTQRAETKKLPDPPGTPLPTQTPDFGQSAAFPQLSQLSTYDPMSSEKENKCAQIWMKIHHELDLFVRDYCLEAGVDISSLSSGRCGNLRPNTLQGHDLRLEYGLTRPDSDGSKRENLCLRVRQNDFEPFVTVWSTNSQMKDFAVSDLDEELKEFLRCCIDNTLTK